MTDVPFFAVIYKPGSTWEPGLPFHGQAGVHHHRDFLAEQYKAETLVFGGPFLDDSGGLAVFQVASREQLEKILQSDRAVQSGLLDYEVRPYFLGFSRDIS
jgi:uncharacterized protein